TKVLRRAPGAFAVAGRASKGANWPRERPVSAKLSRCCLILFGPPGSGKGTQAKLLKQMLGIAHISTGDMLRERIASGDALGRTVSAMMQAGELVPDSIVNQMVEDRIEQPDCIRGFILDGYPRTVSQARLLESVLAAKNIRPKVVHLAV